MKGERQLGAVFVVVLLVVSAGCNSDDGAEETDDTVGSVATPVVDAAAPKYVLLDVDSWEQGEAVRPLTRPEPLERIEPSLDWWAQYERFEPISGGVDGQDLRLSGHHVGLDDQASELVGFQSTAGTVADRPALFATSSEGIPAVVSFELEPGYTIMVLSYALSVDELREVSEHLEPVPEEDWIAAGGQILDCLPPDPGCSPPDPSTGAETRILVLIAGRRVSGGHRVRTCRHATAENAGSCPHRSSPRRLGFADRPTRYRRTLWHDPSGPARSASGRSNICHA